MSDNYEVSRLKEPLIYANYKAYDSNGDKVVCVDLLTRVEFVKEVNDSSLSDSEILQLAPKSKAAAKIRLNNGFGSLSDILKLHQSIPWSCALYYVTLSCLSILILGRNKLLMLIFLLLYVVPLIYLSYVFNLNIYISKYLKKCKQFEETGVSEEDNDENINEVNNKTLKKYKSEIKDLKKLFDDKEKIVKRVVKKRFEPPQLTYDTFINTIDNCHKIFYNEMDNALDIISLDNDSVKVKQELDKKMDILKKIISQLDDLSDELTVRLFSEEDQDEVDGLLNDMNNLIDSVKDYN